MAERRRSAHAGDDQNNGGTLSAKKPRDPQSSYLYRSVGCTAAASRNSVHNVNKDRPEPYEYVKHVYNYNIICIPIYQYICTHFVQMPTLVGPMQVFNGE